MYKIERLVGGNWELFSFHTQEIDRDWQWDRFLDLGIPAEELRKIN